MDTFDRPTIRSTWLKCRYAAKHQLDVLKEEKCAYRGALLYLFSGLNINRTANKRLLQNLLRLAAILEFCQALEIQKRIHVILDPLQRK
jgi:hypothetical protein